MAYLRISMRAGTYGPGKVTPQDALEHVDGAIMGALKADFCSDVTDFVIPDGMRAAHYTMGEDLTLATVFGAIMGSFREIGVDPTERDYDDEEDRISISIVPDHAAPDLDIPERAAEIARIMAGDLTGDGATSDEATDKG